MAISISPSLSELAEKGTRIPEETLEFLREQFRGMLHDLVLRAFVEQSRLGLQQKDLAVKLGRRAEQISRWLKHPGNREVDTVSDLLAAMGFVPTNVEVAHVSDLLEEPMPAEEDAAPKESPGKLLDALALRGQTYEPSQHEQPEPIPIPAGRIKVTHYPRRNPQRIGAA